MRLSFQKMSAEKSASFDYSMDSPKWVTFHDLMDDAMEGGRLFPMRRRMSSSAAILSSTASLSSMSSGEFEPQKKPVDFSQSLGFGEEREIAERRRPERSATLASLRSGTAPSEDKYAALAKLEKSKGSKGWSGKLLERSHGPLGWSDEILGMSTDEESENDPSSHLSADGTEPRILRPSNLTVEEEPWHSGALSRATWDRSPNRTFIRNFP